jgi:hypothetical protein
MSGCFPQRWSVFWLLARAQFGQRRLGGAVDPEVQGLRHAAVVHYSFAFLVLFLRLLSAFF